jgi:tetratricopeptide (TPR) repeat protein
VENEKNDIIARRFFQTGARGSVNDEELAAACHQHVQKAMRRSFTAALRLARKFVARSHSLGPAFRLMAYRSLARTLHMHGSHANSLEWYLKARSLTRTNPLARGQIDRMLIDVYMYVGNVPKAIRASKSSVSIFRRLKAENELAMTYVNYANLLHRQDRHAEAEKLYRKSAEYFISAGDQLATARCWYNQANTLVQLFDIAKAEELYIKAAEIYKSHGYEMDWCDSRYGLSWLWMLTGKFHTALLELAECERIYQKRGDRRGAALCILDRAEIYLALGLYTDALAAARLAQRRFTALSIYYEQAKAALFRSQAAFALRKAKEARQSLTCARSGFKREKNHGFVAVTDLMMASHASGSDMIHPQRFNVARDNFRRAQLPYWEAVCDLLEFESTPYKTKVLQRLARNRAVHHVPYLYAHWQTARGDLENLKKRRRQASQYWQLAADKLDLIRMQLPPIELRGSFARKHGTPHQRLIAYALHDDPATAAAWVERYQTAGIWAPMPSFNNDDPARQAVLKNLNLLAAHVRMVGSHDSSDTSQRGPSGAAGVIWAKTIQQRIRENFMALDSEAGLSNVDSPKQLTLEMQKISNRMPIIQFHFQDNDLIAMVHDQGSVRIQVISSGRHKLDAAMQRWRFILETVLISPDSRMVNMRAENAHWQDLGNWLWRPLNIPSSARRILIIPEGELANLPWEALQVDNISLMDRHLFIIAPSIRHYVSAGKIKTSGTGVEIFRGEATNIPLVDHEIRALTQGAMGHVTVHAPAKRDSWPSTGDASIWHFTGHAKLRPDNPFYSYLELEDAPMFAADFRLKRCRVNLVTLAACRSGQQIALPGEESTGLVRSLLEMGARNIIAGRWPVWDRSTSDWMESFYNRLFKGDDILKAARQASLKLKTIYHSAYHWAAFAVYGAGNFGGNYGK